MSAICRALPCLLLAAMLGLACGTPALAEDNAIVVHNGCGNKMWIVYKCYDGNPWETTACPSSNVHNYIDSGSSYSKAYTYNPVMTCKKIYVKYGRHDRSCENCEKVIKIEYPEAAPKIMTIQGDCTGSSMDFAIVPQGGTVIK